MIIPTLLNMNAVNWRQWSLARSANGFSGRRRTDVLRSILAITSSACVCRCECGSHSAVMFTIKLHIYIYNIMRSIDQAPPKSKSIAECTSLTIRIQQNASINLFIDDNMNDWQSILGIFSFHLENWHFRHRSRCTILNCFHYIVHRFHSLAFE